MLLPAVYAWRIWPRVWHWYRTTVAIGRGLQAVQFLYCWFPCQDLTCFMLLEESILSRIYIYIYIYICYYINLYDIIVYHITIWEVRPLDVRFWTEYIRNNKYLSRETEHTSVHMCVTTHEQITSAWGVALARKAARGMSGFWIRLVGLNLLRNSLGSHFTTEPMAIFDTIFCQNTEDEGILRSSELNVTTCWWYRPWL